MVEVELGQAPPVEYIIRNKLLDAHNKYKSRHNSHGVGGDNNAEHDSHSEEEDHQEEYTVDELIKVVEVCT